MLCHQGFYLVVLVDTVTVRNNVLSIELWLIHCQYDRAIERSALRSGKTWSQGVDNYRRGTSIKVRSERMRRGQ